MGNPVEQLGYSIPKPETQNPKFRLRKPRTEVIESEKPYRIDRIVSATDIISSFNEGGSSGSDIFSAAMILGNVMEDMAADAELIYRERAWYCQDPKENPEYSLRGILPYYFPTGKSFFRHLAILEKHRPSFIEAQIGHRPFEREQIKKNLIPVLDEVAKNFRLPDLGYQSTIINEGGLLLPSGRTATSENIAAIARNLIGKKFDTLVADDPDYRKIFQPDFFIKFGMKGKTFHINVRPDFIEEIKGGQQTTQTKMKKGLVVAKVLVGDFKNSERAMFEDPDSPIGRSVRLLRYFDEGIAQKYSPDLLRRKIRISGRSIRDERGFVISKETPVTHQPEETGTVFICFKEDGEEMILEMPKLTAEEKALAIQDTKDYLRKVA